MGECTEQEVGQRFDGLRSDLAGADRGGKAGHRDREAVLLVDASPRLPAEHRRPIEQHDPGDLGIEAAVQERITARPEPLQWRLASAHARLRPNGHLGLHDQEDRFEQRFLRPEVVVERAAGHARPGHDLLQGRDREPGIAEQGPSGIDQVQPSLSGVFGSPAGHSKCSTGHPARDGRLRVMTDVVFNERVAAGYDDAAQAMYEPEVLQPTVRFLAKLAGNGRALELAIGTGRVALALAAEGIEVEGIEISQPMVDRLRAKPSGDNIRVTIGDMTTTRVDGTYRVVYLVFNTITNLLSQDEQVACFGNAAAHLEPGGTFVIETFIPGLRLLPPGTSRLAFDRTPEHFGIDEYDVANQRLTSHHCWIRGDQAERFETAHRYAWPAEYDLMAQIAGLTLRERWSNWSQAPFTGESTAHVSVWDKPPR